MKDIESKMSKLFKSIINTQPRKIRKQKSCCLCEQNFNNTPQIQHYCKLTCDYLGNAHVECIKRVEKSGQHKYIHVLYRNFSGYDTHLIFKGLIDAQNKNVAV